MTLNDQKKMLDLETIEQDLIKRHPFPLHKILLPTDKIPQQQRIEGLEKVIEIYRNKWDSKYAPKLRTLRERYQCYERAFIIGNGPSLNQTDLNCLKNEVTFGVNGIFLKFNEMEFRPTFYVVEDHLVAEDRCDQINALTGMTKLFPIYLRYCLQEDENTIFFNHIPRKRGPQFFDFSADATRQTYAGGTVVFTCIQLACYFGFKKIYLIGVDCNYTIPEDVRKTGNYSVCTMDMESDDPNHFHPNYFGKGYRWHDPRVDKMKEAFKEAKRVCNKKGVTIYNATINGKLEVFPRVGYSTLFDNTHEYPKILLIDNTKIGSLSATGQLKENFFSDWPKGHLMQVYVSGKARIGVFMRKNTGAVEKNYLNHRKVIDRCKLFNPDVIYYRPLPNNMKFYELANNLIAEIDAPFVVHIADDWPNLLARKQPENYEQINNKLIEVLHKADTCFCISDQMALAYRKRYGIDFIPLSNCVRPSEWNTFKIKKSKSSSDKTFVMRFAGALADNMNFFSIKRVAKIVSELQKEIDFRFELYVLPQWKQKALYNFGDMLGVRVYDANLSANEYTKLLATADALLIAYNFDSNSVEYVRYSMANKFPECLASGTPTLVYGPREVATVEYAIKTGVAITVTEPNEDLLKKAIRELTSDFQANEKLGQLARSYVFKHHNFEKIHTDFVNILRRAAERCGWKLKRNRKNAYDEGIIGPYERRFHARFDETAFLYEYLLNCPDSRVMIDVGAHHGSALLPFARNNWRIFAFEPDPTNREKLLKRIKNLGLVSVDSRAVSDTIIDLVPFYASKESAGISSLTPFRDSHQEVCHVSVTTLSAFCKDKEITSVDFLKIDAEGHDLMVLKGFPWESFGPNVILCEFEDNKTIPLGYDFHEIALFLVDKGYTVLVSEWHPIIRYGMPHDWCRLDAYPCKLSTSDAWGNLIAFREGPDMGKVAEIANKLFNLRQKDSIHKGLSVRNEQKMNQYKPNVSMSSQSTSLNNAESIKTPFIRRVYRRFANYIREHYPTIGQIGLFGVWSIRALKKQMLGVGGITFLSIAGFFVAAFFFENYRWLFISAGAGIVLLLIGGLGVAYARYLFRSIREIQRSELKFQVRSEVQKMQKELSDQLENKAEELANALKHQLENKAEELANALKQLVKKVDDQNTGLLAIVNKTSIRNVGIYQPFNRYLRDDHIQRLLEFWLPTLSLENLDRRALGYLAHRICQIENNCSGRLAATIQDAVLRTLVAQSIKDKKLEILEIGSLFGIGLAIIYDNCRGRFDRIHLTAIDPFGGYYDNSAYDIRTKVPINRALFEHNMRIADIPKKSVSLIQALSTEKKAQEAAAKRSYNMLIVDGDHCYDGVKFDFENYHQMVVRGGYIIFDDYNCKDWPDVTEFVDSEVKTKTDLKLVGSDWRTVVFKVSK